MRQKVRIDLEIMLEFCEGEPHVNISRFGEVLLNLVRKFCCAALPSHVGEVAGTGITCLSCQQRPQGNDLKCHPEDYGPLGDPQAVVDEVLREVKDKRA